MLGAVKAHRQDHDVNILLLFGPRYRLVEAGLTGGDRLDQAVLPGEADRRHLVVGDHTAKEFLGFLLAITGPGGQRPLRPRVIGQAVGWWAPVDFQLADILGPHPDGGGDAVVTSVPTTNNEDLLAGQNLRRLGAVLDHLLSR